MKCKQCNIEFFSNYSKYSNGDFCSKTCSRKYSQQFVKGTKNTWCIKCGIPLSVDVRANTKICLCKGCKNEKKKYIGIIKKTKKEKIKKIICSNCGCNITKGSTSGKCLKCWNEDRIKEIGSRIFDGKKTSRKGLKKLLLEKQKNKCSICGMNNWWNNKELIFILDHIDGHHENNSEDNLRLICPNCDTQLPTFKSKNKGNGNYYNRNYRKEYYKNKNYGSVDSIGVKES